MDNWLQLGVFAIAIAISDVVATRQLAACAVCLMSREEGWFGMAKGHRWTN